MRHNVSLRAITEPDDTYPGGTAHSLLDPIRLYRWLETYWQQIQWMTLPLLMLLMAMVYLLVYSTGGIKYVYSHSMYLVILLGGFILGTKGGLLVGVLAGLTLGPLMPIDVATGEPQQLLNWLYRTGFFALAGVLSGGARDGAQNYLAHLNWTLRHDAITGLANRRALIEHLTHLRSSRALTPQALTVFSLDNVAEMEGAHGPEITDEIVQQLACRIRSISGHRTRCYRINTHQVAMLVPITTEAALEAMLSEFTDECGEPFQFEKIRIHGDIRIGYADISKMDVAPEQYLRRAELALRNASSHSQHRVCFTPELDSINTRENLELLGDLTAALLTRQLKLHYQPKVRLDTGEVCGVEALMRWYHPERGNIPPGKFIPRAEQSTLIDRLTTWALDTALGQSVEWRKAGIDLSVAVNISTHNLMQPTFVDTVLQLLDKHQLDGTYLELEVTEGAFMMDIEQSIDKLRRLAAHNIALSIDDFGTGYSSLRYLNELPVTTIKIDQSFIRSLSPQSKTTHIVKASIFMAHQLGKKIVAEGVEEVVTYQCLQEMECDMAQGYLISRPLPASDFLEWFQDHKGVFEPGG